MAKHSYYVTYIEWDDSLTPREWFTGEAVANLPVRVTLPETVYSIIEKGQINEDICEVRCKMKLNS